MKRKRKLLLAIVVVCLLVAVLAVSLAACDNGGNNADPSPTPGKPDEGGEGGGGGSTTCEHSYDEVEYKEPLCEEDGNIHYFKCTLCGKYFDEDYEEIEESDTILAAKGHETHKVDRLDPTCTSTGNVEYWHCDKCNKNFPDQAGKQSEIKDVTLDKTSHTRGELIVEETATCTTPGKGRYECTVCHQTVESNVVIPAKGHETHKVDRLDPTCTSTGNVEYWHCDKCNKNFPDQAGKQPEIEDVTLDKTSHTPGELIVEANATCTTPGRGRYECTVCHNTIESNVVIPATGHKTHKEAKVEATCESGGHIEYWHCDKCNKNFPDQEGKGEEIKSVSVPELGHSYTGEYGYNAKQHWRKCVRCGKEPPEYSSDYRYDHTLEEGAFLCECGCAPGYDLIENESEKYYKMTAYKGQSENVIIPDDINGIPVKMIGSNVFNNSSIKTVSIGKNVETIGDAAFSGCGQLTEVVIPEGVTTIEERAFQNCYKLQSVTLPSTLKKIGGYLFSYDSMLEKIVVSSLKAWCELITNSKVYNILNVNYNNTPKLYVGENKVTEVTDLDGLTTISNNTFYGQDITSVTIPESLQTLDMEAFASCKQISKIVIPSVKAWCDLENGEKMIQTNVEFYVGDAPLTEITAEEFEGVTEIGDYKFKNCTSLQSVEIPDGLTVKEKAFDGCTGIKTVAGSADVVNQIVKIAEEIETVTVTSGDGISLARSRVKTVNISDGITQIGGYAFSECDQLTTVNIGKDVQSIGASAFNGCTRLKEITLPASLKNSELSAFKNCLALTKVNFLGTVKEWLSIEFADNINHMHSANPLANGTAQLYIKGEVLTSFSLDDVQGVTKFPLCAFFGCTQLKEVSIPSTLTEVKEGAFVGCSGVKKVNIESIKAWCGITYERGANNPLYYANYPNGYSGKNASSNQAELYLNGNKLQTITAEDLEGVTNIPTLAFASCTELTSVEIPESVTNIGGAAFADCTMLTNVTVNGDPKCGSDNNVFIRSTNIQEATVPGGMTLQIPKNSLLKITFTTGKVSGYSFQNAKLQTVILKDGVTEIGSAAFQNCKQLQTLDLGNVQKIMDYAFSGCETLETVSINEGTTVIRYNAFEGCTGLKTLILATSVQTIEHDAFVSCANLSVYYLGDRRALDDIKDSSSFDWSTQFYYYSAESNTDGQHWHWKDEATKTTPVVWGKEA